MLDFERRRRHHRADGVGWATGLNNAVVIGINFFAWGLHILNCNLIMLLMNLGRRWCLSLIVIKIILLTLDLASDDLSGRGVLTLFDDDLFVDVVLLQTQSMACYVEIGLEFILFDSKVWGWLLTYVNITLHTFCVTTDLTLVYGANYWATFVGYLLKNRRSWIIA